MEFSCIDSFCSAGGLGLGLQQAGFNILLSFDIDHLCIDTIRANTKYFNRPAEVADIANMLNGELLKRCNLKKENCFFLQVDRLVKDFRFKEEEVTLTREIHLY